MRIMIDYESKEVFGRPHNKRIQWEYPKSGKSMQELIASAIKSNPVLKDTAVQFVDLDTGETVKGPKYDTTTMDIDPTWSVKLKVAQKPPIEPTQVEPRDRYQENKTMNVTEKFKSLVKECIAEVKRESDPKHQLKESLRPLIQKVLKEIANKPQEKDQEKDEVEKVSKGYAKKGNERLDKANEKLLKELETIVHGIDDNWEVYWDDHGQLIVRAQNLLYVRIVPKFENNFDVDAMVKLVDRIRAIALTWEQVKAFVKANFGALKGTTNADQLKDRAMALGQDREVIKKAAGPEHDIVKNRLPNPEGAKVKDTKRDDKNYNEPQTKKAEDMPDQPMKQVTEPGKDPESKNKNIEKTPQVKPQKQKKDDDHDKLKTSLPATKKFRARKS